MSHIPGTTSKTAQINGNTYHYLYAESDAGRKHTGTYLTFLLIHGFPDTSLGWRNQIAPLLALHTPSTPIRLIIPDTLGYSLTSSPQLPISPTSPAPSDQELQQYTLKSISTDLRALVHEICGAEEQVVLVGHDWGGAIVYRFALWYPEMVKGVVAICTPFSAVTHTFKDIDEVIRLLPNFTYQKQLSELDLENEITRLGKPGIRNLLNAMYGSKLPSGAPVFDVRSGISLPSLSLHLPPSRLLSEVELGVYTDQYARNGVHGPFNYYRTRFLNFKDELSLPPSSRSKLSFPTLFIRARNDRALPPAMSAGMERFWEEGKLEVREVAGGHWVIWEQGGGEVAGLMREWVGGKGWVMGAGSRL